MDDRDYGSAKGAVARALRAVACGQGYRSAYTAEGFFYRQCPFVLPVLRQALAVVLINMVVQVSLCLLLIAYPPHHALAQCLAYEYRFQGLTH